MISKISIRVWGITVSAVCLALLTSVAYTKPVEIPHIDSSSIRLDGDIKEMDWQMGLKLNLDYEIFPNENKRVEKATEALILEDGQALYVAFRVYAEKTGNIRAYLSNRDDLSGSDWTGIRIDTLNDKKRAFEFRVNAKGIQEDMLLDDSNNSEDISWDGEWYSAARVDEKGYTVEMRIPLNILRFEDSHTSKTVGLQLLQEKPRDVVYRYSSLPIDRERGCEVCQLQPLRGFENKSAQQSFSFTPFITLLRSEQRAPGRPWQGEGTDREIGFNFRWSPRNNLVVNATVNPDFSQVEADSLKLNANVVDALFFAEKRPFFLDGSDYFSGWSRLIYTRLFSQPDIGLKTTMTQGQHRVGYFTVIDENTIFLVPGPTRSRLVRLSGMESLNHGFRYRYDMGDLGELGATITSRKGDVIDSQTYAIDGKLWFSSSAYSRFELIGSNADYQLQGTGVTLGDEAPSGRGYRLEVRDANKHRDFFVRLFRFDEGLRADSGFVTRANWQRQHIGATKHWFANGQSNWWTKLTIHGQMWRDRELGGTDIADLALASFTWEGTSQAIAYMDVRFGDQIFASTRFDILHYVAGMQFEPRKGLTFNAEYGWGDAIDFDNVQPADDKTITLGTSWQISDHWNVEVNLTKQRLEVAAGELLTESLVDLVSSYQFDERQSLRVTYQTQRESLNIGPGLFDPNELAFFADMNRQILYSYKVNPFTLVYVGLADYGFKDPSQPQFFTDDRSLFFKFSLNFNF